MSLFNELKRRNVFRIGAAYVVGAWLLIQVAETIFPLFGFGDTPARLVVIVLSIGFIPSLIFSWVFKITSEGLKKDADVDYEKSITQTTGRKLDRITLVVLALALGYFAFDKFVLDPARDQSNIENARQEGRTAALTESHDDKSIAVLPFDNRSNREEDQFFTDGIHDDLLTTIAKIGSMKVISRTSVIGYKDTIKKLPQIAKELGVANILEGGIQRSGNQVRINVQLIDAATDKHLWAETYDRELTAENIFAIQSDIAQVIAQALQAVLTPEEQIRVTAVPTSNFAAYEEFLRGSQKMILREIPEIRQAAEHFHNSIQLDPGYAMAYVGLGSAYHMLVSYGDMSISEGNPLMEAAINTALELDPDLGEAHAGLGAMLRYKGNSQEAIAAFQKAIELAPGYATSYHWLAEHWRLDLNRPDRALPLIRKAQELDPLSPVINITVAETLADLGRHDEALAQIDHSIEISPAFASAYIVKSDLMAWSFGKLDQALQLSDYAVELDPHSLSACVGTARLLSHLGDDDRAIMNIERCLELGPDNVFAHFAAMEIYQVSGDSERTLQHARWVHSINPGWWVPNRVLRDSDIDRGQAAVAKKRYEDFNPEFVGQGPLVVASNNYGAVTDYAYLLVLAGEDENLRRILLPVLEFLHEFPRLGRFGAGIDDVRALAMLGDADKALETLAQAVATGWRGNWRLLLGLRSLDSIRDDPRFIAQKLILERDMEAQLESYLSSRGIVYR